MREFGVRKPFEFLAHLLPQGAWARCSACAIRRRALRGQQGAQLGAQPGSDTATAALQRPIASVAMQQCAQCRETKLKSAFWKEDWRARGRGIKCTTCEPRRAGERPRSLPPQFLQNSTPKRKELTCKQCGEAKARDNFWPRDIHNQSCGIMCKSCQPTPPEERPRGRRPSEANAGSKA